MTHVVPATRAAADWISTRLRPEDQLEVRTFTGDDPKVVIPRAFEDSRFCYTMHRSEGANPYAIFGVMDSTPKLRGDVWMVATTEVSRVRLATLTWAKLYTLDFSKHYTLGLHAFADLRNFLHVRWCTQLGFIHEGTYQVNGVPFAHIIYQE